MNILLHITSLTINITLGYLLEKVLGLFDFNKILKRTVQ